MYCCATACRSSPTRRADRERPEDGPEPDRRRERRRLQQRGQVGVQVGASRPSRGTAGPPAPRRAAACARTASRSASTGPPGRARSRRRTTGQHAVRLARDAQRGNGPPGNRCWRTWSRSMRGSRASGTTGVRKSVRNDPSVLSHSASASRRRDLLRPTVRSGHGRSTSPRRAAGRGPPEPVGRGAGDGAGRGTPLGSSAATSRSSVGRGAGPPRGGDVGRRARRRGRQAVGVDVGGEQPADASRRRRAGVRAQSSAERRRAGRARPRAAGDLAAGSAPPSRRARPRRSRPASGPCPAARRRRRRPAPRGRGPG